KCVRTVERNRQFGYLSTLKGHQDHSVPSTRTIYRRRSILEDRNRFYLGRIYIVQTGLDTINNNQGAPESPDAQPCPIRTGDPRGLLGLEARKLAPQRIGNVRYRGHG